ncbi:hypothetical protein J3R83DRAFT_7893 [Lanmaoa asiatica]|nr:hypothetical protein J3R83DRAFT_7893 [Lanmaoa asiatica]
MASNLLWAHLLRKDATTTEPLSEIPPIAPQDKTGTSMRMLIHDTQVNLEKFSTRLDYPLAARRRLQSAGRERKQAARRRARQGAHRDTRDRYGHTPSSGCGCSRIDEANRSQAEMKAHVGTPAQASTLDLVHVAQVSTEKSVQALEKRIDALQAVRTRAPTP